MIDEGSKQATNAGEPNEAAAAKEPIALNASAEPSDSTDKNADAGAETSTGFRSRAVVHSIGIGS